MVYHLPVFMLSWPCTSRALILIVPLKLVSSRSWLATSSFSLSALFDTVDHLPRYLLLFSSFSVYLCCQPYLPGLNMKVPQNSVLLQYLYTYSLDNLIYFIKLLLIYSFIYYRFYVLNFYLHPSSLFLNSRLISICSVPPLECLLDISNMRLLGNEIVLQPIPSFYLFILFYLLHVWQLCFNILSLSSFIISKSCSFFIHNLFEIQLLFATLHTTILSVMWFAYITCVHCFSLVQQWSILITV